MTRLDKRHLELIQIFVNYKAEKICHIHYIKLIIASKILVVFSLGQDLEFEKKI